MLVYAILQGVCQWDFYDWYILAGNCLIWITMEGAVSIGAVTNIFGRGDLNWAEFATVFHVNSLARGSL